MVLLTARQQDTQPDGPSIPPTAVGTNLTRVGRAACAGIPLEAGKCGTPRAGFSSPDLISWTVLPHRQPLLGYMVHASLSFSQAQQESASLRLMHLLMQIPKSPG